jgi:hypothetical protein
MPVAPCTAGGFFVERSKVLTFRCLKIEVLACISHHLSAAAVNLQQSAAFAPIGVLDVPQVRAPRLRGSARAGPQRRPLRAPWVRIRGAATTAMSLHRRGAATKKTGPCRRNPPGRWGSRPISALLVVDDARASTSSSRLDLDSRDPSADGSGDTSRASWSQTPHLTTASRSRDESW